MRTGFHGFLKLVHFSDCSFLSEVLMHTQYWGFIKSKCPGTLQMTHSGVNAFLRYFGDRCRSINSHFDSASTLCYAEEEPIGICTEDDYDVGEGSDGGAEGGSEDLYGNPP